MSMDSNMFPLHENIKIIGSDFNRMTWVVPLIHSLFAEQQMFFVRYRVLSCSFFTAISPENGWVSFFNYSTEDIMS